MLQLFRHLFFRDACTRANTSVMLTAMFISEARNLIACIQSDVSQGKAGAAAGLI